MFPWLVLHMTHNTSTTVSHTTTRQPPLYTIIKIKTDFNNGETTVVFRFVCQCLNFMRLTGSKPIICDQICLVNIRVTAEHWCGCHCFMQTFSLILPRMNETTTERSWYKNEMLIRQRRTHIVKPQYIWISFYNTIMLTPYDVFKLLYFWIHCFPYMNIYSTMKMSSC